MDTLAIRKWADYIEALPKPKFNMATFGSGRLHECGTSACIAGHIAAKIAADRGDEYYSLATVAEDAAKALGLDDIKAGELFYDGIWQGVTPQDAASVMRNLAKTGKVNWAPVTNRLRVQKQLSDFARSAETLAAVTDLNLSAVKAALKVLVARGEAKWSNQGYTLS